MTPFIALMLVVVFAALSLLHAYWVLGGTWGLRAAIPEREGRPAFVPAAGVTAGVALGLAACAALAAALGGWLALPLPRVLLLWLARALAAVLVLRAVGDFRWVGFFKRVHDSPFAWCDTWLYSPLCLLLAVAWAHLGWPPSA